MKLKEIQKEIVFIKNVLAKVPALEARLHRLLGMEEILLLQENDEKKPELKVATK